MNLFTNAGNNGSDCITIKTRKKKNHPQLLLLEIQGKFVLDFSSFYCVADICTPDIMGFDADCPLHIIITEAFQINVIYSGEKFRFSIGIF